MCRGDCGMVRGVIVILWGLEMVLKGLIVLTTCSD